MNTIVIDLDDLRCASDALAALSGLLAYPGAAGTDDWIARATASTRLGFPAHFRTSDPPTYSVVVNGLGETRTSMSVVHAIGAFVARVNRRAATLTGFPVISLSLAS